VISNLATNHVYDISVQGEPELKWEASAPLVVTLA
jgi:hypothetical protein